MPKKKTKEEQPTTSPDYYITSALRLLWLRSRERATRIRIDKNTCTCGAKGSQAKGKEVRIEVHHTQEGDINWKRLLSVIREELLCTPDHLVTLCRPCHYKLHGRKEPKKRATK